MAKKKNKKKDKKDQPEVQAARRRPAQMFLRLRLNRSPS